MKLDQDMCYRALKSRDARFDGQFFTAVLTTGIYCRPICPAPTPKQVNVRFFSNAAAAQEAGFRPCLRCRPETSPGTPAWQGTSSSVTRALRLIEEGALDEGGVEALAAKLGVGGRHLRRLFIEHLGVTPVAVAQTRRLHFAKKLIDETPLSMGDIAFNAGYSSIRRFNTAFRSIYGCPPSQLRRAKKPAEAASAPLILRLSYRPPFDWESMLDFLSNRATAGVERVKGDSYRRTVSFGDAAGTIEVRNDPVKNALTLSVKLPDARKLQQITTRVRRLFDLESNPEEIATSLGRDHLLRPLIVRYPGLRVPGAWDPFEMAVRVILGQQVSVKGATTLAGRLAQKFGQPLAGFEVEGLTHISPRPEDIMDADLSGLGIVGSRIRAIQTLARGIVEGQIDFSAGTDPDALVCVLESLPGIGSWTAQVIAMRVLGEPDAFPASDLGIVRALRNSEKKLSERDVLARAEIWRPWRAYAALYLWKKDIRMPEPRRDDKQPRARSVQAPRRNKTGLPR